MRAPRLRAALASISLADLCQQWAATLCVFTGIRDTAIPNRLINTLIKSAAERLQYEKRLTHLHVLILYYLAHPEVKQGLRTMGIGDSALNPINDLLSPFKRNLETKSKYAFFLHDPENPGKVHAYKKQTQEWVKQTANIKKNSELHIDRLSQWIQQFRSLHADQPTLTLQGIHYIQEWIASLNAVYSNLSSAFKETQHRSLYNNEAFHIIHDICHVNPKPMGLCLTPYAPSAIVQSNPFATALERARQFTHKAKDLGVTPLRDTTINNIQHHLTYTPSVVGDATIAELSQDLCELSDFFDRFTHALQQPQVELFMTCMVP